MLNIDPQVFSIKLVLRHRTDQTIKSDEASANPVGGNQGLQGRPNSALLSARCNCISDGERLSQGLRLRLGAFKTLWAS